MTRTSRHTQRMLPVLLLIVLIAFAFVKKPHTNPAGNTSAARTPAGSLSLITEPTAGVAPVLSSINSAKSSVDLVMYELEDAQVEQALGQAEQRGVHVRVLLNGGYYGRPDKTNPNQTAYDYLQSQQVPVRWTPSYFALTHQKTLIIDGKTSLIMTFNLTPQYYSSSRDFGIIDKDAPDVSAIESTFNGDWQDKKMTAPKGDELVWSPGSETTTIGLINQAKTSLKIYNEEMADTKVVSALGAAALRGVNEKIVMTDSSEWHANFAKLKNDGAVIKIFASKAPLYIHAKMIVVDNTSVFVGSENFSTTSLTRNRELGIVTPDKTIISSLDTTFSSDFQNATPY